MMQDAKHLAAGTSAKGKAKEDAHWHLGWWELHPLIDRAKRPVAWSKSSVIFSAHPTQPLVLARHFSSSRQFVIPSPTPLVASPTAYEPPTVISISPSGDWLFAYFPGRDGDGVACLWKRGIQLDSYSVRDFWTTPRGAGIVTAAWTNHNREWVLSDAGVAYRQPPRGPVMPINSSALLLVTQSLFINACFLPPSVPSLKILRAPLTLPSMIKENEPSVEWSTDKQGGGGHRSCVSAAIGFSHNDSAFLVATRSLLLPSNQTASHDEHAMDIGLPLDLTQIHPSDERYSYDSDIWGEELVIDVCEVGIQLDPSNSLNLGSRPLPPLFHPSPHLIDLAFFSIPPESPANQSPAASKDPRRQVKEGAAEKVGSLYLTATVLDCGDYATPPRSEVTVFACVRNTNVTNKASPRFMITREYHKVFDNKVLGFLSPSGTSNTVLAGLWDTSGVSNSSRKKSEQVQIGTCLALQFPSLNIDDRWEPSRIMTTSDRAGRDVPAGVAISQNRTLVCCMSSSTAVGTRTSIHPLPRRHVGAVAGSTFTDAQKNGLSRALCLALMSRESPSDIIHSLSLPSTSMLSTVTTLYNTLCTLAANANGLAEMWLIEVLGVITEVYLGKARYSQGVEKENLTAQWMAAHDICSIEALNTAFEDCRDGNAYDLEAIWQLVGLSIWFMDFLQRLLKECILFHDEKSNTPEVRQETPEKPDTSPPLTPAAAPILIHAVHPYVFKHMLAAAHHVKRFRDHIGGLSAKGENAQIAKDILMDAIDCSGIQLDVMIPLLAEVMQIPIKVPQDQLRRCLTICAPVPRVLPFLKQSVEKIVNSNAIDRAKLFIKVSELVDGVSQMSLAENVKVKNTDVVTKGLLLQRGSEKNCVRCGGRSEIGGDGNVAGHISLRWQHWEKMWATRCVCGGAWTRSISS